MSSDKMKLCDAGFENASHLLCPTVYALALDGKVVYVGQSLHVLYRVWGFRYNARTNYRSICGSTAGTEID
jgi:hypothetical protein